MQTQTVTVWLPRRFWQDRTDRALPSGKIVEQTERRLLIEIGSADLADVRSDAEFYAQGNVDMDTAYGAALQRSAAATVKAIDKVAPHA